VFNENELIGQDTNRRDGWTLAWRYQDEPLLAHLTVTAVGANGTQSAGAMLGLYHPDPVPRILSVTTTLTLPREGGFLRLPAGAGSLVFRVRAVHPQKVRFFLSPTGTNTSARLLVTTPTAATGGLFPWRMPTTPP